MAGKHADIVLLMTGECLYIEPRMIRKQYFDRVIIRLGAAGNLLGFDVDTANFNGNEGPAASIDGVYMPDGVPTPDSPEVCAPSAFPCTQPLTRIQ